MRRALLFFISFWISIIVILFPVAGTAQSPDGVIVKDDANLFGNKIGEVESAAAKLAGEGADVRVRTILTYGTAPNLDAYEQSLEQNSPSWLGQDGDRKNNLIAIIIALQERKVGIYYGAYWGDTLDKQWLRIQNDVMVPRFSGGDYTGGTVSGLEELQKTIATGGQVSNGTGQPAQTNAWLILGVIVVIIAAAAGLFFLFVYRKNRAKVQAIRQKALLAKQGAASGINELLEAFQMLEIKVNVTADKITADEALPLRDDLEKAKTLVARSSQAYSELAHSAGDPENPRLGQAELGVIETEYQKILGDLRQAREAITGVENRITAVQQLINEFPAKVVEIKNAIAKALEKQEEISQTGLKATYAAELLGKGQKTLEQAQALFGQKRLSEGVKYARQAGDLVTQAFQAAEEVPRKKQEAAAAIPALSERIERVKETIKNGRIVFERVSGSYAVATWESVRGNGTEAENRVDWALESQEAARLASGMEQQEWHKALEFVEKGNGWLTEAESLIKSITDLEGNLITARRDAPNEIAAAQADITRAWDYINRYDEDIRESLEDDLRGAEAKNEQARAESLSEKPDYFKICRLAREANEAADKILVQARDEHEAAERLRAKAASVRRDAYARVSIAKKYVEDHHPVVRNEARDNLNRAIGSLRQSDNASELGEKIARATEAESAANTAYSLAQADVNRTNTALPGTGNNNMNIPGMIISSILMSGMGRPSGQPPVWGSPRTSGPSAGTGSKPRPSGGGSSSWRGGGGGGGGSGKGGGSTGW